MALVGKVIAIDCNFAIVNFKGVERKALNIANSGLNDFVVVKGNLIIEKIPKRLGKEMLKEQTVRVKSQRKKGN